MIIEGNLEHKQQRETTEWVKNRGKHEFFLEIAFDH